MHWEICNISILVQNKLRHKKVNFPLKLEPTMTMFVKTSKLEMGSVSN